MVFDFFFFILIYFILVEAAKKKKEMKRNQNEVSLYGVIDKEELPKLEEHLLALCNGKKESFEQMETLCKSESGNNSCTLAIKPNIKAIDEIRSKNEC